MSADFDVNMYIITGADGAMRVGGANVPIDSVLTAFHQGHSPSRYNPAAHRIRLPSIGLPFVSRIWNS